MVVCVSVQVYIDLDVVPFCPYKGTGAEKLCIFNSTLNTSPKYIVLKVKCGYMEGGKEGKRNGSKGRRKKRGKKRKK